VVLILFDLAEDVEKEYGCVVFDVFVVEE